MTVSTCHSAAKKGFVKQDRRNSDPKACNDEKIIGQKNSSKRLVKLFVKNSLYKIRQKIVKKKIKKIVKKIIKKIVKPGNTKNSTMTEKSDKTNLGS